MKIEKFEVCEDCWDNDHTGQCNCFHGRYKTITLEFEVCECCDRRMDEIADTEFNKKLENIIKSNKEIYSRG